MKKHVGYLAFLLLLLALGAFLVINGNISDPSGLLTGKKPAMPPGIVASGNVTDSAAMDDVSSAAPVITTGGLKADVLEMGDDKDSVSLYLDGVYCGSGSCISDGLAVGRHTLTANKTGYADTVMAVQISAGKITYTDIEMQIDPAASSSSSSSSSRESSIASSSGRSEFSSSSSSSSSSSIVSSSMASYLPGTANTGGVTSMTGNSSSRLSSSMASSSSSMYSSIASSSLGSSFSSSSSSSRIPSSKACSSSRASSFGSSYMSSKRSSSSSAANSISMGSSSP
ncbi:MAG: PEGA domain-containing protein [Candidatus Altiarchaeota archaeon]|nr:PEGA domain-containing protein [Candidatus Altiarchaeota archaeon]